MCWKVWIQFLKLIFEEELNDFFLTVELKWLMIVPMLGFFGTLPCHSFGEWSFLFGSRLFC
jgi:hypothetical protein